METPLETSTYLDVSYSAEDDLNDLRVAEEMEVPPPAPKPKPKKKKRASKLAGPFEETGYAAQEGMAPAPFEHAAAGMAAAGIMTSALAHTSSAKSGKLAWKPLVVTCAAVGLGALYLGVLYFLYKKMSALEESLKETMEEMRKIADFVESDQKLDDEPLPPSAPRPIHEREESAIENLRRELAGLRVSELAPVDEDDNDTENENDAEPAPPKVQELPTPPRGSKGTPVRSTKKRRSTPAGPKPVVLDLDHPVPPPEPSPAS